MSAAIKHFAFGWIGGQINYVFATLHFALRQTGNVLFAQKDSEQASFGTRYSKETGFAEKTASSMDFAVKNDEESEF
jgi:hypothetical protein